MADKPTLLVTGASGQLGQRVVELLLQADAGSIVAVTRNPDKLSAFAKRGVDVRYGDFDKPESLDSAFAGVDRLLLISTDALDGTDKRLNQHKTAVKAAETAGVKHILYTSIVNADDNPILFAPDHAGTEAAIKDSSMDYTILRNNLYMDLVIQSATQAIQSGQHYSAGQDGAVSYITREDCARVAASALSSDFSGKRILTITGAKAYTQGDIVNLAAELSGKEITYVPVDVEAVIEGMVKAGLPQPIAETYASIDIAIAQGKLSVVSSAAEDLIGEQPTSLDDFLTAHRDAILGE